MKIAIIMLLAEQRGGAEIALLHLIQSEDADFREQLGQEAARLYKREFAWERVIARMLSRREY